MSIAYRHLTAADLEDWPASPSPDACVRIERDPSTPAGARVRIQLPSPTGGSTFRVQWCPTLAELRDVDAELPVLFRLVAEECADRHAARATLRAIVDAADWERIASAARVLIGDLTREGGQRDEYPHEGAALALAEGPAREDRER